MSDEKTAEKKRHLSDSIQLLANIRLETMQLIGDIDTTDTFKQRLRERIAAGEYALRHALEDLQYSLTTTEAAPE